MVIRGIIGFLVALVLLLLAGKRSFGRQSALDNVIMFMLGAVLSRAVTGSVGFLPVIGASVGIVSFHRLLSWISLRSRAAGALIKGLPLSLYKSGKHNN